MIGAKAYATVMIAGGVIQLIQDAFMKIPLGPVGILILMMIILFILGCFLDPITIVIITIPVFLPIVKHLGFDPVWYGVLFVTNLQLGYVTPPFGMSLFYLKGVAPKEITLNDIYRSVWPFILVEIIAIALLITFPQLIMWII